MEFSLNIKDSYETITYNQKEAEVLSYRYIQETEKKCKYSFGEITFREIQLQDIGAVLISNYHLEKEGLKLQNTIKEGLIEMHFNLGNSIEIEEFEKNSMMIKTMSCNLFAINNAKGFVNFGKGRIFKTFDVHLNPSFLEKFRNSEQPIARLLDSYEAKKSTALYPRAIPISTDMQETINKIIYCNYTGYMRKVFLKSKVQELFIDLLAPSIRANKSSQNLYKISNEQIRKINMARQYIENNFTQSLDCKELSERFQISKLKLGKGFKILFGHSIYEHLQICRMEYANSLLLQGIPISKVYSKIGYSNNASFSRAFKKHFGFTPANVKKIKA